MQNKYKLNEEVDFVHTLKTIVQAYEEVSVIKMQRIRSSVLSAREFLSALSTVFGDVKTSYHGDIMNLYARRNKKDKTKPEEKSALDKNGREAVVLLSSNAKLYGDIVRRVFQSFIMYIGASNTGKLPRDIVIVGKVGREFFEQSSMKREYSYFEIPDFGVSIEDMKPFAYMLADYEKVTVFHGQFENVLNQEAIATNVSGEEENVEIGNAEGAPKVSYFFEPSLDKILHFFETQVFSLILKQTIHEGELSRVASRLQAMENALSNIQKDEERLTVEGRMLKRQIENKKRLETFSGIALWNK